MALKDEYKTTGKNLGKAFKNFGSSMGKTMKIAFTDESVRDDDGRNKLGKAWSETGRSFGKAGKSMGRTARKTAKKVIDKICEEDEPEVNSSDDIIDVKTAN